MSCPVGHVAQWRLLHPTIIQPATSVDSKKRAAQQQKRPISKPKAVFSSEFQLTQVTRTNDTATLSVATHPPELRFPSDPQVSRTNFARAARARHLAHLPPAAAMSDTQVATWLRGAGLSRFAARFAAAGVSTPRFLGLAPRDLDGLGVDSPADRKRLADLIAELRRARTMPPLEPPAPAAPRRSASMVPETRAQREARERARARDAEDIIVVGGGVGGGGGAGDAGIGVSAGVVREREERAMPAVRVCVRKRPLSQKDVAAGERDIISTGQHEDLFVHEVKTRLDLTKYVDSHEFAFDRVFSEKHDNVEVYAGTARPLVDALFAGWRSTCFAYGQTGTGKTYTMEGTPGNPGLYLLAVDDVFERASSHPELSVWISFFEIYGTRLHDLLNNRAVVQCREDAASEVRIQGLTERRCSTPDHVLALIGHAAAARSTGVTGANDDSSRSHAVFQIELRRRRDGSRDSTGSSGSGNSAPFRLDEEVVESRDEEVGRLSFIDLAGSERGSDTASSTLQTRREGAEINKSLLALKECIRAMDQGNHHTPFRGSKLTQVLKASFVGRAKCRTVMIANVSPASPNVEHTLNTLRYSQRVKEMKSVSPDRSGGGGTAGGSGAYSYGVPTAKSGSARSIIQTRSAHATPVGSPDMLPLKSDLLQMQRELQPLQTPSRKPFSRTSSAGPGSFDRRHTLVGTRAAGGKSQSGRLESSESGRAARFGGNNVELGAERDRGDTSNRPGREVRRRVPMSKSMIPTRSRRSTLAAPQPLSIENGGGGRAQAKATQHPVRPKSRDSSAPTALEEAENSVEYDDESDDSAYASVRRMTSEPTTSPRVASRPAGRESPSSADTEYYDAAYVSDGEGLDGHCAGDARILQSRLRSGHGSYAAEAAIEDQVDDDDDLLYSSPPTTSATPLAAGAPPPALLAPAAQGIRTRRMVVPASARRRPAEAPSSAELEEYASAVRPEAPIQISPETSRVAKLHHEKARELTDLVRSGVELMHSVEAGQMAPGAYATKLEVNLAMCMDLVHTLKVHVATLGAQER
jgi:Kinesin motor domain/SAM domain (Sterile alpha motif)